ncbi:restriction endonuclease subunit S [Faecalibacter macacae]|uniref:restriction endonuclease subunit S n=1 Tax=Faecalibacter macacae TaxID=1859289 RepID=UPI001E32BE19|nr:restriction endonuclease subunit S [Faecalibacter macacae]
MTYVQYKDSGIDWIGQIPAHWELEKFKYLGFIYPGLSGKKGDDFNKEIFEGAKEFVPFTTICNYSQIKDERFQYVRISQNEIQNKVIKNDLLFLMSSETLNDIAKTSVYLLDKSSYLNSFCKGFRISSTKLNSIFTNYLLSSKNYRNYYELCGRGFTRINIKQEYINDTIISIPPIHEQEAIANFLDEKTAKIDALVQTKKHQIEKLKELRQAKIHQAVTKGLDANAPTKYSGVAWIGEIPAHWEVKKVKEIFKLIIEPAPIGNDYELLSVYTDIGVKPRKELEEKGNKASTTDGYWIVRKGDIIVNKLLAWMGAIGISNYNGVTSPAYDILRNKVPIIGLYYHNLFRMKSTSTELKRHSRGIMEMRLRLYFEKFGQILVPYPPLDEQEQIVAYLDEVTGKIDEAIAQKQEQITKLKEYKQSLINDVVTGKVKVC